MIIKKIFIVFASLIMTTAIFLPDVLNAAGNPDGGTIPLMKKAPVIDGVIKPDEWMDAIKTEWFQGVTKGLLEPRQGSSWVGCDKDKLYISISSELPPAGNLITTVKMPDGMTIYDDSIELCIDPFIAERLKDNLKPLPYYHFIGNSLGFIYDEVFAPGKPGNSAWNGKWEFKNGLDLKKNRWEAEIAIAWNDLGITPGSDMIGRAIGLSISRNWKNPWTQSVWFPCTYFTNPTSYPMLKITANAPVIQLDSMGDIFDGKFNLALNVINPTDKKIDYAVSVEMKHSDMPTTNVEKSESVDAGKNNVFSYKFIGDGFHADAKHTVSIKVTSPDRKQEYYSRTVNWIFPVESRWQVMAANQDTGVKFAYYPSYNKMRIQIEPGSALGSASANELRITINSKDYKGHFDNIFKLTGKEVHEFTLNVPDFEDGTYKLNFEFMNSGVKIKTVEKEFERIHFAWENNKLGDTDKVYPPFTPIKADGNAIEVVLRKYELDKLGLPQKIIIGGHDIMASGGMKINYLTGDGKSHEFSNGSGKFIEIKDSMAVYEGQVESTDIKLKARSTIEYDGCAKVELDIAPITPGKDIKELYLDIPLKKEYALLWHIVNGSIRSNPAGAIPDGEGVIWDSSQTGNGAILGTFLPYIWLGRGEGEGIAWFADSDKGWSVDDKNPQMKIIRNKNGEVTLRIFFINKPVKLEKSTSLIFGWQASPTKPMPEDFRSPKTVIPMHGGSNRYWGIRPAYAGKYPAEHDYEFADQLLVARRQGKMDQQFLDKWYEKHYGDVKDKEFIKSVKTHIRSGMNKSVNAGQSSGSVPNGNVLMLYFEEHCQDQTSPEWKIFQDEWGCKAFSGRKWHQKIMTNEDPEGVVINPTSSYRDFTMWEAKEWLKRGIGIYCDNTFLNATTNMEMSEGAYRRFDGNIQPGVRLWEMREYHKRMWVLTRQMREISEYPLYISLHMTNGNVLPIMTWADISLDLEWKWNGGNQPFPPELLQVETTGRQIGCYSHALSSCTADKKWFTGNAAKSESLDNPAATRHDWGIRMVHEILRLWGHCISREYPLEKLVREFGYGEPNCKVYNYWQDNYPIAISNDKVKSIAFENNGKVMVILTSWIPDKTEIMVRLQGALSAYSGIDAIDPEDGKAYQIKDGGVLVPIDKWGVRVILLGGKQ